MILPLIFQSTDRLEVTRDYKTTCRCSIHKYVVKIGLYRLKQRQSCLRTPHASHCCYQNLNLDDHWHCLKLLLCKLEHIPICNNERHDIQSSSPWKCKYFSSKKPISLQVSALLAAYMNMASPKNTKAPPGDNPIVTINVQLLLLTI